MQSHLCALPVFLPFKNCQELLHFFFSFFFWFHTGPRVTISYFCWKVVMRESVQLFIRILRDGFNTDVTHRTAPETLLLFCSLLERGDWWSSKCCRTHFSKRCFRESIGCELEVPMWGTRLQNKLFMLSDEISTYAR